MMRTGRVPDGLELPENMQMIQQMGGIQGHGWGYAEPGKDRDPMAPENANMARMMGPGFSTQANIGAMEEPKEGEEQTEEEFHEMIDKVRRRPKKKTTPDARRVSRRRRRPCTAGGSASSGARTGRRSTSARPASIRFAGARVGRRPPPRAASRTSSRWRSWPRSATTAWS